MASRALGGRHVQRAVTAAVTKHLHGGGEWGSPLTLLTPVHSNGMTRQARDLYHPLPRHEIFTCLMARTSMSSPRGVDVA